MLDHDARSHALIARVSDGQREGLSKDDILDNVTLYWMTNTAVSESARFIARSVRGMLVSGGTNHPLTNKSTNKSIGRKWSLLHSNGRQTCDNYLTDNKFWTGWTSVGLRIGAQERTRTFTAFTAGT
jgi:hypothetical protein